MTPIANTGSWITLEANFGPGTTVINTFSLSGNSNYCGYNSDGAIYATANNITYTTVDNPISSPGTSNSYREIVESTSQVNTVANSIGCTIRY